MSDPSSIPPTVPERPLLLVGNPTSHSGKAARRIQIARDLLDRKGIPHLFHPTLPGGRTVNMVRDAIDEEGFRTLVYMGGDGTFYEVATGIVTSHCPGCVRMGMLPSGTANDQGKSFGISSDEEALPQNIDIILKGHTTPLDVGQVTAFDDSGAVLSTDYFFDSLGWGLSAAILAVRNKDKETVERLPVIRDMYRDQAVYVRAAIQEFAMNWLTGDRFSAEIEVDGVTHFCDHLSDLIISNTLIYAGEWIVDPDASASDGMVEIAPFRGLRDWTSKIILRHRKVPVREEMLNRIGISHAPHFKGAHARIQILRPQVDRRLPAQRDGEEFVLADHYTIDVLPRLLSLIVPKNFQWV